MLPAVWLDAGAGGLVSREPVVRVAEIVGRVDEVFEGLADASDRQRLEWLQELASQRDEAAALYEGDPQVLEKLCAAWGLDPATYSAIDSAYRRAVVALESAEAAPKGAREPCDWPALERLAREWLDDVGDPSIPLEDRFELYVAVLEAACKLALAGEA